MIELTGDNFDNVKSADFFLVDFSAEFCMPCKMMKPTLEELESEYTDKITMGEVDVSNNHQLAIDYNVTAVPTIIIFKDGKIVKRLVGGRSKSELKIAIDEVIGE